MGKACWSSARLMPFQYSSTPALQHSSTPTPQHSNTPPSSYQLPLLHVEILGNELRAQFFVVQQRKAHAAPLQHLFQFTQFVPEHVSAQALVDLIERAQVHIREKRSDTWRLEHVHQDQMLAADQVQAANKTLGEHRIVQ